MGLSYVFVLAKHILFCLESNLDRQLISVYHLALRWLGTCLNSILFSWFYATTSRSPRKTIFPMALSTIVEWQKKCYSLITLVKIQDLNSMCVCNVSGKTELFLCYVDKYP